MSEDINTQVIKKTQRILGKYVKKPPLTDKLLKKPPFRFLHDIINGIINQTGYLKGLFSEEELKNENVKEKDDKIAFLSKLIDAVKATTKTDLTVRPSKIVAGLEPTKTNLLLQAIGTALDAKIDTSEYIAQLKSNKTDNLEKKRVKKTGSSNDNKVKAATPRTNSRDKAATPRTNSRDDRNPKNRKNIGESPRSNIKADTPKDSVRSKSKTDKASTKKETKNKIEKSEVTHEKLEDASSNITTADNEKQLLFAKVDGDDTVDHDKESLNNEKCEEGNYSENKIEAVSDTLKEVKAKSEDNEEKNVDKPITEKQSENNIEKNNIPTEHSPISGQSLRRPKSARPKSGERHNVSSKRKIELGQPDDVLKPVEMTVNPPIQRPKSSLRPPSVRPSSARPGAPRLRPDSALPLQETITMGNINVIIENVDSIDEEETVVIQTMSEVNDEPIVSAEVPQENKGQLVEQILEQIQEEDGVKKMVDIDWEEDVLHNKDGASREISQLRTLIQTLTRTANPLGKLMNYLHEDIDAMHSELQTWTNVKNQLLSEINKQKRLSAEMNKPLLSHLQQLQEDIKKQEHEITNVRSNILRNELRIKELLNI